jgi:hypothetical protein
MSYSDFKLNWQTSIEKIRNRILIEEQRNTDHLNIMKKKCYLDEAEDMELEIDKYNIYFSQYGYWGEEASPFRWFTFRYKYKSKLTARWKLLQKLKYDEFSYAEIFKEGKVDVVLIKLSNQEVLYIYDDKQNKSLFHFENMEKFYDWVESDEKHHFTFELGHFRKFLNRK